MDELLRPLNATAHLCGLEMGEPLILHSAHGVDSDELERHAARYRELLAPAAAASGH